jgi:hypothetical protein
MLGGVSKSILTESDKSPIHRRKRNLDHGRLTGQVTGPKAQVCIGQRIPWFGYPAFSQSSFWQPSRKVRLKHTIRNVLNMKCSIPILGLFDGDPYGLDILSVYKYGSFSMRHQNDSLSASRLEWLGVYPGELQEWVYWTEVECCCNKSHVVISLILDRDELLTISKHDHSKVWNSQTCYKHRFNIDLGTEDANEGRGGYAHSIQVGLIQTSSLHWPDTSIGENWCTCCILEGRPRSKSLAMSQRQGKWVTRAIVASLTPDLVVIRHFWGILRER